MSLATYFHNLTNNNYKIKKRQTVNDQQIKQLKQQNCHKQQVGCYVMLRL